MKMPKIKRIVSSYHMKNKKPLIQQVLKIFRVGCAGKPIQMLIRWSCFPQYWLKYLKRIKHIWMYLGQFLMNLKRCKKIQTIKLKNQTKYSSKCKHNLKNFCADTQTLKTEILQAIKFWLKWKNKWHVTKKKLKTCKKWKHT